MQVQLAPGQLVDASLHDADSGLLRAALRDHRAVLIRGQERLQIGGLDWLCRHVFGGTPYDPREHGAKLLDPDRSWSYLVTNVADAATGRVREGELLSGSADAGSQGNHEWCGSMQSHRAFIHILPSFTSVADVGTLIIAGKR